jgi:hypothetical protein
MWRIFRRTRTLLLAGFGATLAAVSLAGIAGAQQEKSPPVLRSLPTVEGEAREEKTLTAKNGEWDGKTPITFAYEWRRCNAGGTSCVEIAGETKATYTVRPADVNSTLRVRVTATNADGSATAASNVTPVVVSKTNPLPPGSPLGAVRLATGETSIPASSLTLPNRLVISNVQFSPPVIRSRVPFTGRFRVTDTRGFAVRDVLVRVIGVPYSRIQQTAEQATDTAGWAQIQLTPTARLQLRNGFFITMFVRARKQGDDLLAGVSTRRLVQVRLGQPAS